MSELIDREALKDAVKRYADEPTKEKDRKCQAICLDMLGTIDSQPTASPWHRVEEELPEIGKAVVVSIYGDMWVATRLDDKRFNGRMYWELSDGSWERVENDMYWMPIEPPKEDA